MLGYTLLCFCAVVLVATTDAVKDGKDKKDKKDDGGITAANIGTCISAGASLFGRSLNGLKHTSSIRNYVSISGFVENYTKWPMIYNGCEIKRGQMNVPIRTVAPGLREGFASHRYGFTKYGSWIKCSFKVNKAMVHYSYDVTAGYKNTLSLAVCPADSDTCTDLNARKMYFDEHDYIARRKYNDDVDTLKKCNKGICMIGVMGTSLQTEVFIKVMPESHADLFNPCQ